jgi:hypothetical protein
MKNVFSPKTILLTIFMSFSAIVFAQERTMQQEQEAAKASLAGKKFNLLIHSSDGQEGIKDYILFTNDGFETRDGKSSTAANSRFAARQDEKGNISFTVSIVTSEGMKTYSGLVNGERVTGKYIFEPTGQSAISYSLNGTLDKTK